VLGIIFFYVPANVWMPSMVVAQGFWVLRTLIKVGMLKNRCPELFRNSMLTHTHTHTHTR